MNQKECDQFSDFVFNEKPIFKKLIINRIKNVSSSQNFDNISKRSTNFNLNTRTSSENMIQFVQTATERSEECKRRDIFGIPIIKRKKKHKVTFKSPNFQETIVVENYKVLNFLERKNLDFNKDKDKVLCQCCMVF